MKKLGYLLLLVLLGALSGAGGRWLHAHTAAGPASGHGGVWQMSGTLGLLLLAWLLAAGLHELGHALLGRWQGFQFQWLAVGPFRWQSEAGRVRLRWNTDWYAAGGMVLSVPTDEQNLRWRFFAFAAGGPLASLAWAALTLGGWALLPPAGRPQLLGLSLGLSGVMSLLLGVLTLLPLRFGGFASDGMRLLSLWRGGAASQLETTVLAVMGCSVAGTRPRELPLAALAAAEQLPDALPFKPYLYHYLYLAALDAGQVAQAGHYLAAYRQRLVQLPAAQHGSVWLESAFFAAAYAHDLAAARAFRAQAVASALIPADVVPRVAAALAQLAGDATEAHAQAQAALRALPRNSDRGSSHFYAEWLHETLRWAAQAGAPQAA